MAFNIWILMHAVLKIYLTMRKRSSLTQYFKCQSYNIFLFLIFVLYLFKIQTRHSFIHVVHCTEQICWIRNWKFVFQNYLQLLNSTLSGKQKNSLVMSTVFHMWRSWIWDSQTEQQIVFLLHWQNALIFMHLFLDILLYNFNSILFYSIQYSIEQNKKREHCLIENLVDWERFVHSFFIDFSDSTLDGCASKSQRFSLSFSHISHSVNHL